MHGAVRVHLMTEAESDHYFGARCGMLFEDCEVHGGK